MVSLHKNSATYNRKVAGDKTQKTEMLQEKLATMDIQISTKPSSTPFLKWAGGKRWLVENHFHLLDIQFERYIEPFLGSGAVFFSLTPKRAILCDKNAQLIQTYLAIRNDWPTVELHLRRHHRRHCKEYYYNVRAQNLRSIATRAARFIYLNRTCWNGLYRVNLNGQFNVPIGTKTNVVLGSDNFEGIASCLVNAELIAGDFQKAIDEAGAGDFVFVDPPYTVKHNHNGFIKYNETMFSWADQIRLRNCVSAAVRRGARVLVTNAYHKSIRELYQGVGEITKLSRSSLIAGSPNARGSFEEMVIKCY